MLNLSLIFLFVSTSLCPEIIEVRTLFHAIDSEEKLIKFTSELEQMTCDKVEPYLASAIMQQAEYAFFPTKKMSFFKKGKKRLENYILQHPKEIEAKYVRYLIQNKIPSFLNYNDNISADRHFIETNIKSSGLPEDFQNLILKNVTSIKL